MTRHSLTVFAAPAAKSLHGAMQRLRYDLIMDKFSAIRVFPTPLVGRVTVAKRGESALNSNRCFAL